jgi:hypothetical protein
MGAKLKKISKENRIQFRNNFVPISPQITWPHELSTHSATTSLNIRVAMTKFALLSTQLC